MKEAQLNRYERQTSLEYIKYEGQKKMLKSKVLVVGLGGLGSTAATFLVRMGIGEIGIIDDDNVDVTNLPRQILYNENDIGKNKIYVGVKKLKKINKCSKIIGIKGKITDKNVEEIIKNYDVILDCTDNFITRGFLNRACIDLQKTCVFASVNNFEGFITVLKDGSSPCYECLMGDIYKLKEMDNKKRKIGVLGSVVGTIASMQATEAVKIILGIKTIAVGKLIIFNALNMTIQEVKYLKRKGCFCEEK